MANTPTSEIFKDRRVQIGAAVAALLVVGGGTIFALNSGGGGASDETASAPPPAPAVADPAAPGGAPVGGPGTPGSVPGAPPRAAAAARPGGTATATAIAPSDSWAGAPSSFPGGGGTGAGAGAGAGTPGTPGAPGAPAAGGPAPKLPKPIQYGSTAQGFRGDPFLSTQRFVVELPYAYQFIAPIRLASYPKPVVPRIIDLTPEERLGPIPFVARRVAGVLYDGAVSAILETGTPGPEADVRVIQPGSLVPSGIPGLEDLTVSVITTTKVTLRDQYNRTVDVPLQTLPREIGEALRQQAGQQAGQGGAPGGGFPGGGPDGPGGPGGFPGAPGGPRGGRGAGGRGVGAGGFRGADQ